MVLLADGSALLLPWDYQPRDGSEAARSRQSSQASDFTGWMNESSHDAVQAATYVKSATHSRFGPSGLKSRLTRSRGHGSAGKEGLAMTAWQQPMHDRSGARSMSAFESSRLCSPGATSIPMAYRGVVEPDLVECGPVVASGVDHETGHLVSRAEDVRYFEHFAPDSRDWQLCSFSTRQHSPLGVRI